MERRIGYQQYSAKLDDKVIVVLEFGRRFTRCGFAGESAPRAILKTTVKDISNNSQDLHLHHITDTKLLYDCLGDFIERIYFDYLAVSPKEKKLVVVESVFCKSLFRNTLTRVFFDKFQVPSILYVPNHLMALATLGLSTGLVVDIGASEAVSIAVVNGVTLLDGTQFAGLGAQTLDSLIHNELVNKNESAKEFLKQEVVEDIRIKSCFVAPFARGHKITNQKCTKSKEIQRKALETASENNLYITLSNMDDCYFLADEDEQSPAPVSYSIGDSETITIPGNLREGACEILFEIFGDEHSLTTMIIETILASPIDCRRALAENIFVIGGLANLPGLEHRLLLELQNVGQYKRYATSVPSPMKLHRCICPRNYVSWLGASLFCTSSFVDSKSTSRDQWVQEGRRNLRDWSDLDR